MRLLVSHGTTGQGFMFFSSSDENDRKMSPVHRVHSHTHTHIYIYMYIYIYTYGDFFVSLFLSLSLSASFSAVLRVNTCLESTVVRARRMLKMSSYQYMDYHYQNKTVSLQSHLYVRESLNQGQRSSYWNGAHLAVRLKSIGRRDDESQ